MAHSILYVGSSMLLRVRGVQDHEGNYLSDATVTIESLVERRSGNVISGMSYPTQLTYIPGSNGDYEAEIPHDLGVKVGGRYILSGRVVTSQGYRHEWDETILARRAIA